jgi:hypothetical protein
MILSAGDRLYLLITRDFDLNWQIRVAAGEIYKAQEPIFAVSPSKKTTFFCDCG